MIRGLLQSKKLYKRCAVARPALGPHSKSPDRQPERHCLELTREQGFVEGACDIFDLLAERNTEELKPQKRFFNVTFQNACRPSLTVNPKP